MMLICTGFQLKQMYAGMGQSKKSHDFVSSNENQCLNAQHSVCISNALRHSRRRLGPSLPPVPQEALIPVGMIAHLVLLPGRKAYLILLISTG
jgi:hypothetical protein